MQRVDAGASTSRAEMLYQCSNVSTEVNAAVGATSPAARYDVVREPRWVVAFSGTLPYVIVTERRCKGFRLYLATSVYTALPGSMVTLLLPLKVR